MFLIIGPGLGITGSKLRITGSRLIDARAFLSKRLLPYMGLKNERGDKGSCLPPASVFLSGIPIKPFPPENSRLPEIQIQKYIAVIN